MEQDEKEIQLPSVLSISKFSVARGKEIQILNKALSSSTGIKLAFQKLPKHMRRRAMSHNVKRLPRRLRQIHMNQMTKSGLPPKQKRPSRKYRRRPFNLMSEYMRRQRKHIWLNTHIWHAKRFHMIEKWGYKLPHSPCDRAFRACYRATTKHCLLQDISYYNCIELNGNENHIVNGFKQLINSKDDLSIGAKSVITGLRQGKFTLLKYGTKQVIGPVYFLWKPLKDNTRTLWLWLHAAYYQEGLDLIKNHFCLNITNSESEINVKNGNLELKVLTHDVCRFRLIGPLANAILWNALKLPLKEYMDDECNSWAKLFLNSLDESYYDKMTAQWTDLQYMSSPAEFSPNIILPLIVQDPRFNMPKKRTKSSYIYNDGSVSTTLHSDVLENPIWDSTVRRLCAENKLSQNALANLRANLLVPGTSLEKVPSLLPITLVQIPGRRSNEFNGYGCGWDLILPSAWAQPVWLALIMWGARSGGLREMDSVIFESDQEHFLYPDTHAGKTEEKNLSCKLKDDYFKLPPNKRTNYNKFAVTSPLSWNWELLLKEWECIEESAHNFSVLRNRNLLRILQNVIRRKTLWESVVEIPQNTLIPVSVKLSQKGACKKLALICLPKIEDLSKEPVEPLQGDPNEAKRMLLRHEHKDILKRLRRKRRKARKSGETVTIDLEMLKEYSQKMRQLWIPETTTIRHSCSREVMGYIKHGDFSFNLAKTKGIGYITIASLKKYVETRCDKVLVRNTNSRKYRSAILDVICEN